MGARWPGSHAGDHGDGGSFCERVGPGDTPESTGTRPSRTNGATGLRVTKLGRILVMGQKIRIPKPVVLEMIKAALNRPWSSARRDRNQVVCRFRYGLGSLIKDRAVLFCQTNRLHLVDPSRLKRSLAKLPPVSSRQEFEVIHHGRPVSEWFVDKGQLVKVVYFRKRHAHLKKWEAKAPGSGGLSGFTPPPDRSRSGNHPEWIRMLF